MTQLGKVANITSIQEYAQTKPFNVATKSAVSNCIENTVYRVRQ